MKHSVQQYLSSNPKLKVHFKPATYWPEFIAEFVSEGDYFLRRLEAVGEKPVCDGCGSERGMCPTWGTCDWEVIQPDELEEHLEEMAEHFDATYAEVSA